MNDTAKYKISDSTKRLAEHIVNQENIHEIERKKLAQELHNGVCANMAAIQMIIDSALILSEKNPNLVVEKLLYLQNLVRITLKDTIRISNQLRSELLENGFEMAIKHKLKECEKQSNLITKLHITETAGRLSKIKQTSLYKSFLELLDYFKNQNDITALKISLSQTEDIFILKFQDNGIQHNMCLSNFTKIEARIRALNGNFNLQKNQHVEGWITSIELMLTPEEITPIDTKYLRSR